MIVLFHEIHLALVCRQPSLNVFATSISAISVKVLSLNKILSGLLRTCVNTEIDISGPFPKRHFCRIKTSKVLFNYAICAVVVFSHAAVKNPVSYCCPGLLKYAFFTVKKYSYLSFIGQPEFKPQKTFFI